MPPPRAGREPPVRAATPGSPGRDGRPAGATPAPNRRCGGPPPTPSPGSFSNQQVDADVPGEGETDLQSPRQAGRICKLAEGVATRGTWSTIYPPLLRTG